MDLTFSLRESGCINETGRLILPTMPTRPALQRKGSSRLNRSSMESNLEILKEANDDEEQQQLPSKMKDRKWSKTAISRSRSLNDATSDSLSLDGRTSPASQVNRPTFQRRSSSNASLDLSSGGGYASSEGDTIKVYVRVRPPAKTLENDVDQSLCLEVNSASSLILHSKPEPKVFSYDHVADMNTTQEEVFSTVGRRIIEGCVGGYNGTIFAYGQTGSGKTFTMLGPPDECDNFSQELRGVIPRGFEYMFSLIKREEEKHGDKMEFLCRCSFLEIYNEQIFDLLDPASVGLHLREDIKKGVFVEGLKEVIISSAKDAYKVLTSGWNNRRVASTSMNRESSRSHAVFTVSIESKETKSGMSNIKLSRLHLVDLAGSERQKDTHTEGIRLKEAGSINKSLSALGNVIMALVDIAHGKQRYVHYRDSKLTFILRTVGNIRYARTIPTSCIIALYNIKDKCVKDSLGGNAKTYIIANIHPSAKCFGETLSTLNFARRAKMIKNKAVVNEDVTGNVVQLQAEIRKLKELLAQARAGIPTEPQTQESSVEDTVNIGYDNAMKSSSPGKQNIDQAGDVTRWKELMLNAISEKEKSENEKQALAEKVQKLEELCSRKEKFLQSTKMIVKFRESHIKKLELKLKKEKVDESGEEDSRDKEISLLKEEVKILQDKIEHHPDVTRFAMENLELRAEIKRLKSTEGKNAETSQDKTQRYTMQLERQLRDLLTVSRENDLEKSLSSSLQSLEASNAEIERLKLECTQLQSKYEYSQQELVQNRQELQRAREEFVGQAERFRLKELDLESELAASKRARMDIERALESHQLKTAVERTALNDIHMQTIKTLASPQKFGSPMKSTPRRGSSLHNNNKSLETAKRNLLNASIQNNSTTESPQFITEEKPLTPVSENGLMRRDSLNESDDDEEDDPFFDFHTVSMDAEEVYTEALMDELKKLQDLYNQLHQQMQGEEAKRIKLNQMNTKLQHQVNEFTEILGKEREKWLAVERNLNNQLTSTSDQLKREEGEKSVLKSEVEDLKILLQSADKQLENLKRERNNDIIDNGRKCASLESKLLKVETDFYSLQSELDDTAQANQQLRSDVDNYQVELDFTRHKNVELEKIITCEREKNKELENKLQATLKELEIEIETNLKLMQQDHEEEVFRAVEQANELRKELQEVNYKLEKQEKEVSSLTKQLEDANIEIASLNRNSASDKEAINNFRQNIQELRMSIAEKEAELAHVRSLLEETNQMHKELTQSYEEKKKKIAKLSESLRLETERSAKERSDREKDVKQLREELEQQQQQYVSLQAFGLDSCTSGHG